MQIVASGDCVYWLDMGTQANSYNDGTVMVVAK